MRASTALFALAAVIAIGCGGGNAATDPGSGGGGATCTESFRTPNYVTATDPGTSQLNQTLTWSSFPVPVYKAPHHVFTFGLNTYDTDNIAQTALDRWVAAVTPGLSYQFVGSDPAAGISITYNHLPGEPTAGDALGVTTLFYNASTGVMHKADTVINYWDTMTEAEVRFGLLFTTTHEFGHALFINGHSPAAADVMYYAASTVETRSTTVRDANTLATAYCGTFPTSALTLGRDVGPYTKVVIRCLRK
ncbi:MAG: matrixin family metalloprotease [Armatimonadota bacterium]